MTEPVVPNTVRAAPAPVDAPSAEHHNRIIRQGYKKAADLEGRMVNVLVPIFKRAGREAAANFTANATNHLTAAASRQRDNDALVGFSPDEARTLFASLAVTAAAPSATSAMVALYPTPSQAAALTDTDPDQLHVTLCYLGEVDADTLNTVVEALATVAGTHAPLSGVVGGTGRFEPPGVNILLPDVPGLVELRVAATQALVDAGIDYSRDHGFQAHASVDEHTPDLNGSDLSFDAIHVVQGDNLVARLPLTGAKPLTAAGKPPANVTPEELAARHKAVDDAKAELRTALSDGSDNAHVEAAKQKLRDAQNDLYAASAKNSVWSAPAPAEVLDVNALIASLRTKTEPVRQAMVASTAKASIEQAGISFDVSNPYVSAAVKDTASQITNIAQTTMDNVTKVIQAGYEQGLSIPDVAKSIKVAMDEQSTTRAVTIARTTLAGATASGSLAATQAVQVATGTTYSKVWMCVPPGTRVQAAGVLAVVKKPYDGELVTIATLAQPIPDGHRSDSINQSDLLVSLSQGAQFDPSVNCALRDGAGSSRGFADASPTFRSFTVTPDHLVLTRQGWVPAGLIEEGDDVIGRSLRNGDTFGDPDVNDVQPLIEDVFDAALVSSGMMSTPVYFDCGVIGEKIDVVSTTGGLVDYLDASTSQEFREFMLSYSDVRLDMLLRGGAQTNSLVSHRGSLSSSVAETTFGEQSGGVATMPQLVGLDFVASGDSVFGEDCFDGVVAHAEDPPEFLHGDTALVQFDQVVSVDRQPFTGHVYDLTTFSGWFLADDYVAHNTAPGAPHPRHEDYPNLDGQSVALDATFEVGDDQLMFPGDPGGSPEETINCRRCTMSYSGGPDAGDEVTADDSE